MSGLGVEGGLVGRNVSGDVWGGVRQPIPLKSLEISGEKRTSHHPVTPYHPYALPVSCGRVFVGPLGALGVLGEDLPVCGACVALWGIWACLMGVCGAFLCAKWPDYAH